MADPVLTDFQTSYTFDENTINAAAVILDSSVDFTNDADNFDGTNLIVRVDTIFPDQLQGHVFSIVDEGTGEGEIGFDGTTVTFSGTPIGTVTFGAGMVVTFNDAATDTAIGHLIEAITYQYTLDVPPASISFALEVSDEDGDTLQQSFTINYNAENDPPVAKPDQFVVNEDSILAGNVLDDNGAGPDSDPDELPTLSVKPETITTAFGGIVSMTASGAFTYAPPVDFSGTDSFTYTLLDEFDAEAEATVTVDVLPTNDPTYFADALLEIPEGQTRILLPQPFDVDNDAFSFREVGGADSGSIAVTENGELVFKPEPDFEKPKDADGDGVYEVVVEVSDNAGGTAQATIQVKVLDLEEIKVKPGKPTKGTDDDDLLEGSAKDDEIKAQGGNDVVDSGKGNDTVKLGDGDDFADLGGGKDKGKGGKGNDHILGGGGKDQLNGNKGDDTLDGGGGNDTLKGGNGKDKLKGAKKDDMLKGGKGKDKLDGGKGKNTLEGGKDEDTFVLSQTEKAAGKETSKTKIADFETGDQLLFKKSKFDKIDPGKLKEKDFHVGKEAKTADHKVVYDQSTGLLYYDPDGSGKQEAKLVAKLKGNPELGADDIIVA